MNDPVDRDLNEHLRRLELADAFAEACKRKVEEWMQDPEKIAAAWEEMDFFGQVPQGSDIAVALIGHPDDRAIRAMRLLNAIEEKVREQLDRDAEDAVRLDIQVAKNDTAESRAWAREDDKQ